MTDRDKALMRVQTYGFALTEATLFLDTHTTEKQALDYYHNAVKEYDAAVTNFITNFGPLQVTQVQSHDEWTWAAGCMPWEENCNVEL